MPISLFVGDRLDNYFTTYMYLRHTRHPYLCGIHTTHVKLIFSLSRCFHKLLVCFIFVVSVAVMA